MSRGVSSSITSGVTATVTRPVYLVKIAWSSGTKYYSSRETISFQVTGDSTARSWTASDIKVSLNPDAGTGTIKLGNTDYTEGKLVISDGASGTAIAIYALYGEGSWSTGDEECLFSGIGGQTSIDMRWTTIQLMRVNVQQSWAPRQIISQSLGFNHLPPETFDVSFGGEVYRISRKRS